MKNISCYKCGVVFGMSDSLYNQRKEDGELFSCPNGHEQYFAKKEKLEKQLTAMTTDRDRFQRYWKAAKERGYAFERRISAFKGVITKMKNKMFCQCPRCGFKKGKK